MASTDITLIGLDEATLSDDLVTVLADPSTNGGYKASVGDLANYIIANAGLDYTDTATNGTYVKAVSESDGVISVTRETADTTPTEDSTKLITSGGVESALSMDLTSVSGNPITISDASNTNCETLVATLSPTQASGTPTPSNPLEISGVSTLNVYHAGKNLCPMPTFSSAIGYAVQPTNKTDIINLINSLPAGNYTVSAKFQLASRNNTSDNSVCGFYFSGVSSQQTIGSWGTSSVGATKTVTNSFTKTDSMTCTVAYFYGCGNNTDGATGTARVIEFQVEYGSSATTYEPYQGTAITLNLGSNVYGGSVDLSSGVLTVDKAMVDLGDLTWTALGSDNIAFRGSLAGGTTTEFSEVADFVCSHYPVKSQSVGSSTYTEPFLSGLNWTPAVVIWLLEASTPSDVKNSLDGVQLVYPLATPTTTTLTAKQIRLLQGNNTLWTNGEGLEVEYQPNNFVGKLKAWILDQLS